MKKPRSYLHIGMRNIKTALAATLCAMFYLPFERNPTFACIGAIFGMGSDMGNSWLSGGNRLFGTCIGGVLGMVLFRIYIQFFPEGGIRRELLLFLFVGVILLILVSQILKWPGAIQPGGVVLCILLFNTPVATYISYSLNRIIDTGIGVVIAWIVNLLLPRDKVLKVINPFRLVYNTIIDHANSGQYGRDFDPELIEDDDDDWVEPLF